MKIRFEITIEIILGMNIKGKRMIIVVYDIVISGFSENKVKIRGRNSQKINNFHLVFNLIIGLNTKLKLMEISI